MPYDAAGSAYKIPRTDWVGFVLGTFKQVLSVSGSFPNRATPCGRARLRGRKFVESAWGWKHRRQRISGVLVAGQTCRSRLGRGVPLAFDIQD